jgi:GRIP domain
LEGRVEELLAYLDRSKKFQGDGPDTATNTEYLKNCVYRFMATTEHSERKRLAPVISTILKLTSQEKRHIDYALSQGDGDDNIATLASFGAFAGSFFGATPHANTPHSS